MRQLMKSLITLWVALSVSMGSYGALPGNAMKGKCGEDSVLEDPFTNGVCMGYISGIIDMDFVKMAIGNAAPSFCVPDGVTMDQKESIVIKYMEENPEMLHHPFAMIVIDSLSDAFPCDK